LIVAALCIVQVTVNAAPSNVKRSHDKRFGCVHYICGENEQCHETHYGDAYCLPDDYNTRDEKNDGRNFVERLLESYHSKREEQRSYNKRYGCNRYECGDGKMCLENRYGDAYCVPSDTPGVSRDAIEQQLKGVEKSYDKRYGCNRHECGDDLMCLENRFGDAYCVPSDTPGVSRDEIADDERIEDDIEQLRDLIDMFKKLEELDED